MTNCNYSVVRNVYISGNLDSQTQEVFGTLSEVLSYLSKEAMRSDDVDMFGDFDGQVCLDVAFPERKWYERYEIRALWKGEEP